MASDESFSACCMLVIWAYRNAVKEHVVPCSGLGCLITSAQTPNPKPQTPNPKPQTPTPPAFDLNYLNFNKYRLQKRK